MGFGDWMRVIDTLGGLVQTAGRLRSKVDPGQTVAERGEMPPGGLEARLAGVVVAALKEAFDRDRARMDLERSQVESERKRAEEALAAELRRQSSERGLGQLRMIAIMAIGVWMLSAALAVFVPGMHASGSRAVLGAGWLLAFCAIGCAFAGWQQISAWTEGVASERSQGGAAAAAPWFLLAALAATAASLLMAL